MTIEEIRAVVSAIKNLHQYGSNIRKVRAEKFSGNWTNEGSIGGQSPSHYVNLELIVEGVEVSGIITSRKLDDETCMNNQSFTGRRSGYRINGQVITVSQGRVGCYGHVRLHLRNGVLHFKSKKLIADFLPITTTLWRHD